MAEDLEIDLNLLLALGALLEDRNLTRAGERIGMSQPAMSAALARLRRHFGDDLLEREGRGYKRTVLGEQLLPTVREALRQVEATMQRSPTFDPAESDREFSIAASDYAVTILADPLLRLVKRTAPRIRLNLHPLPASLPASSQALSTEDLLIGPVGYDFPGRHAELFRDRFVCVVDAANPWLRDGRLTLDDLSRMPHAAPTFAPGSRTPVDRVLDELGVAPRVRVTVFGWLSVPFVLAGTEMVAIMPERMARLAVRGAPLAILEPPFDLVELVEAAYWHPSRTDDPAVRWLLSTMKEAARELLSGFRSSAKQSPHPQGEQMPSPHGPRWLRRVVLAAAAASAVAVALTPVLPSPARAAIQLPVNYDFIAGATATALAPNTPPPGADNWQAASPLLADNGYCVYAFNFGGASATSPIQGTGEIAASAAQLATFVNAVLAKTGASKVDLVGHSQGCMMPRYYITFLGGAAKVGDFVALAPSNYGTTLDGLTKLASLLGVSGGVNGTLSSAQRPRPVGPR